MKKKVFIIYNDVDKTEDDIFNAVANACDYLERQGYEAVDTYTTERWGVEEPSKYHPNTKLNTLGNRIKLMAHCGSVYVLQGSTIGDESFVLEYAAINYGLEIMRE